MKPFSKPLLALSFILFSIFAYGQRERMMKSPNGEMKMMKKYFLCMLSRGKNVDVNDTSLNGHRALMAEYHSNGTIILSGPLESTEALGAYLYDVDTIVRAEELIKADPAVISGRFTYKILTWWVQKETIIK